MQTAPSASATARTAAPKFGRKRSRKSRYDHSRYSPGSDASARSVEVGEVLGIELEERHVDVLHGQVAVRVERQLVREAEIDDARDAVPLERLVVPQPPDVVRPDHDAETGPAALLGREAAEVADVQAAVPAQRAARLRSHPPSLGEPTGGPA
jgi:hypothetical protein